MEEKINVGDFLSEFDSLFLFSMSCIFINLNVVEQSVNDIDNLNHIIGDVVLIHLFLDEDILDTCDNL